MHTTPIITCFDDQDAYKFFMQNAVLKHYPEAKVRYSFILRDATVEFPPEFGAALKQQVAAFENLRLTDEQEEHLTRKIPWFTTEYLEYLRKYRFSPGEVTILQNGGALEIGIEGLWHKTILWEVPLLACISELYYRMLDIPDALELNLPRWEAKFRDLETMKVSVIEFGTRRRKSKQVQEQVIERFLATAPGTIIGTSNVMFARKFGIPASGTQAHEWYMFHAARYGVQMATTKALDRWIETFHGALGIALTDTYTTEVFFRDFGLFYSKLFDGIRQDSGDPVVFARIAINHYQNHKVVLPNGMIPKILVFSDALDACAKIAAIERETSGRIFTTYGIGTWLTNDVVGAEGIRVNPLNMVIKMTAAQPEGKTPFVGCYKLTDSAEKRTGDPDILKNNPVEQGRL